ncbi:MAG: MFS transporter [Deltaproteobacteria bacterium]|nr:MFS transporter [Deltaproteobacteria bacterium]
MQNISSDTTQKHPPLSLPFYYGWLVVSLCFLTTLTSAGVRSSPQVLILPLQDEFGWSRALIASAISMNLLLFGVAGPISGYLIDRFGPRKVMMGSLLLLISGVSGTIAMTQFWQFFLVWGIIVGLGAGGVGSVLTATVGNRWFFARRGLALGILGSASLRLAHRLHDSHRRGVGFVTADFPFYARRSRGYRIRALWSRSGRSRRLRRCHIAARHVREKRDHYSAGGFGPPDFLAAVRQLFRVRWNGERLDWYSPDPARD